MDYFQFNAKRLHLNMVAFGWRVFWPVKDAKGNVVKEGVPEMTPARFDLLFAVHGPTRRHTFRCGIAQAALRRALALSRPTVSKMLKRLEELGLVWREPCCNDRRGKWVNLTEEGRKRIRAAMAIAFGKKPVAKKLQAMYGTSFRKPCRARAASSHPTVSSPPLERAATTVCCAPKTSCDVLVRAWGAAIRAGGVRRRRACRAPTAACGALSMMAASAARMMVGGASTTTCNAKKRANRTTAKREKRETIRRRRKRRMTRVRWKAFDVFLDAQDIAEHFGPGATLTYESPFPIYS